MRDEKLTLAAAELARAAPNRWQEFLAAFEVYSDARKDELVRAESSELARSQGRAQLAASLFGLFGNAVKDADGIAVRKERRSN